MKKILIPPYSRRLKNPPYPEHVIEDLRERMNKGPVTLGREELERIIAMLEILSDRCGEAYQVVGQLANFAEMKEDPALIKALDLLAWPLNRGEILPFNPKRYERPEPGARMPAKAKGKAERTNAKPVRTKAGKKSRS